MKTPEEARKIIDGSKEEAERFYREEWSSTLNNIMEQLISSAIMKERLRFFAILKAIEPHNEAEAHLIETIVRRMRGEG